MNTFRILARLHLSPAMLALAMSAAALVPCVHAQLPPPEAPVTPTTPTSGRKRALRPPPEAPVAAVDVREFDAAMELVKQEKWFNAMMALENFRSTYKAQSSKSIDAKYWLGIVYLRLNMFDDAAREFRQLLADPKIREAEAKEGLQLLVVQAMTANGASLPAGTEVQKQAQWKAYEEAIAEADKFLAEFPKSKSLENVQFNRGSLLLIIEQDDQAVHGLAKVVSSQSPLRWQAQMAIGKARMAQAYKLLSPGPGKERQPEEVKQALKILQSEVMPDLAAAYEGSRDLGLMNEAIFLAGQIRLTQHQNAPDGEDPNKQEALLSSSLDVLRAVRSTEEVVAAHEAKIETLKKQIAKLAPGSREYTPYRTLYEGLIDIENKSKARVLGEQDQLLAARLTIARIFLLQGKPDECRTLVRLLQEQKALLQKEKNAGAELANLLCRSYIEQKNLGKGLETWEAFRKEFNSVPGKGDKAGEALTLALATLCLEGGADNAAKAAEVLRAAREDYKPWAYEQRAKDLKGL